MDLLIDQEIFKQFFFKDAAELHSEKDVLLFNIFNNKNASIVVNQQIILNLLSEAETDEKKVVIKRYFDHLRNNSRILSIAGFNSLSDFLNTQTAYQSHEDASHFLIIISDEKDDTINTDNYIALKDENILEKNTAQYNIAQIAAHNRLTIRHLDFLNNTEIEAFFKQIFNFVDFSELTYVDRYALQNKNPAEPHQNFIIFNLLLGKKYKVYASQNKVYNFNGHEDIAVFTTTNTNEIHERILFFHHFVIESDDDFNNIFKGRNTWKIDIHYDKKLSQELQFKLQNFIPFEYNSL